MEDLTKQQMVLLTVLVSFVCSVATSITIVSLLTESSPTISQTINNIVEKTIERVVTGTTTPTVIKTPTSTMTENERMIASIQSNLTFMANIATLKTETNVSEKRGIGFVADPSGLVVTDKSALGEGTEFSVTLLNGKIYAAKKVFSDEKTSIVLLQLLDEKNQAVAARSATLSEQEPKLGQTVIALGGKGMSTVYQGIVSEMAKSLDAENPITRIITTLSFTDADRGGPLFGVDGKIIGINMLSSEGKSYSLHFSNIRNMINDSKKPKVEAPSATAAAVQGVPLQI